MRVNLEMPRTVWVLPESVVSISVNALAAPPRMYSPESIFLRQTGPCRLAHRRQWLPLACRATGGLRPDAPIALGPAPGWVWPPPSPHPALARRPPAPESCLALPPQGCHAPSGPLAVAPGTRPSCTWVPPGNTTVPSGPISITCGDRLLAQDP